MSASVKSAFLRTAAVKHNLGITSFTMPTGCYLALYTSNPTVSDTGTEVTGGSYARQNLSSKFGSESGGIVASNASVTFSSMPACTVSHWGIRSASSGGNLLYFGAFDLPIVLNSGDSFTIASGDIKVQER
jgi:hypothetical protein